MKYIFISISILFSSITYGQESKNTLEPLDELLNAYEQVHGFSGSVMLVEKEETVFEKSFGLANRSFDIPNQTTTRNSINSISKTFTAVAVLKLVEAGQVELQQAIGAYLPLLEAPWKDSVTVHQLLSHTSGLPREAGLQAHESLSFEEQIEQVNQLLLLFEPGTDHSYSNVGYLLLGALIEAASQKSYAQYIQETIIHPLDLPNTGVYEGFKVVSRQAVPYKLGLNGIEFAQRTKTWGDSGGGGLYSTPADLYQFTMAIEKGELLPDSLNTLIWQDHTKGNGVGYGWEIQTFGSQKLYMAAGSGYGTKSVILRMPEQKGFIGIVSNWGNTPILNMLQDLFLLTQGEQIIPPSTDQLAGPEDYQNRLGLYEFDPEQMRTSLQMEDHRVPLQEVDGKLFFGSELLAKLENGKLGLTYTKELQISFEKDAIIIEINGVTLKGKKIR